MVVYIVVYLDARYIVVYIVVYLHARYTLVGR
jgi:hypothetical protein